MLSLVLAASLFLASDPNGDGYVNCELPPEDPGAFVAPLRVFVITANNVTDSDACVPPGNFYAGSGPQRAFLAQYSANSLKMDGFRTILTGSNGNTLPILRVAFTRLRDETTGPTTDPRFHTILDPRVGEVQVILHGSKLVVAHIIMGSGNQSAKVIGTISPLDFVDNALELDTRVQYNPGGPSSEPIATIQICTRRGVGNCFTYEIALPYYATAPEFYLGDTLLSNTSGALARYCRLPSPTSGAAGYSNTCRSSRQK